MLARFRDKIESLGPSLGALLLSDSLSLSAVVVGQIATSWWVVSNGGGSSLALYAIITTAGSLISLPLLSPLGDRYCKRNMIVVSLGVMTVAAIAQALLAQLSIYSLPLVISIALIKEASWALFLPASGSIVAERLPADKLTAGLGLQKSSQFLGRMLGPALGGAVLAVAPTAAALWLYAALVGIACTLATRIPAGLKPSAGGVRNAGWATELWAGLAAKWHIKVERWWTLVSFLLTIFLVPGIGMLLPLKIRSLGLSGAWLGWCEAAMSAGMLSGALGLSAWLAVRFGRFAIYTVAFICIGLCFLALGMSREPLVLVLALALIGACLATNHLVGQTHRMLATPPTFRGRMNSVQNMVMQAAGTIGPAVAGVGLDFYDVGHVYLIFGCAVLIMGAGYSLAPGYRSFIGMSHDAASGYYEREYPELFSQTGNR